MGGQRETSKYRAIAAAKPGVWYEVSQEDQGIAKEPFLRISNELSRSWDELIANKKAALTPQVDDNCNIFPLFLDDQYRDPSLNGKDHLVEYNSQLLRALGSSAGRRRRAGR